MADHVTLKGAEWKRALIARAIAVGGVTGGDHGAGDGGGAEERAMAEVAEVAMVAMVAKVTAEMAEVALETILLDSEMAGAMGEHENIGGHCQALVPHRERPSWSSRVSRLQVPPPKSHRRNLL